MLIATRACVREVPKDTVDNINSAEIATRACVREVPAWEPCGKFAIGVFAGRPSVPVNFPGQILSHLVRACGLLEAVQFCTPSFVCCLTSRVRAGCWRKSSNTMLLDSLSHLVRACGMTIRDAMTQCHLVVSPRACGKPVPSWYRFLSQLARACGMLEGN